MGGRACRAVLAVQEVTLCLQAEVGGVLGSVALLKDTHCSVAVAPLPPQCQRPNKPEASFQAVRGGSTLCVRECETPGRSCLVLGFWDQAEGSNIFSLWKLIMN